MNDGGSERDLRKIYGAELLEVGEELAGYRLVSKLGAGGYAFVYQARDPKIERDVALKVILPSAKMRVPDLAQRFEREIDIIQRFDHPNIVRLYDFGEAESGHLYMSMELVRGGDLSDLLKGSDRIEPERAIRITRQILEGLSEPHQKEIVHRDIKPGNIMLTESGLSKDIVKVLDFGLSKAFGVDESQLQNLTLDATDIAGTPRYMALEQIKNEEVGPHTDVYAIGLILYEMIVGQPAFDGSSPYQILSKQMTQDVEMPDWLAKSALGPIIDHATQKDWTLRYPDAVAFHTDLIAVSEDEIKALAAAAAKAGPKGSWKPSGVSSVGPRPSNPRKPLIIAALAAALIGVIVIIAVFAGGGEDPAAHASDVQPDDEETQVEPAPEPDEVTDETEPDEVEDESTEDRQGAAEGISDVALEGALEGALFGVLEISQVDDTSTTEEPGGNERKKKKRKKKKRKKKKDKADGSNPFQIETH